MNTRTQLFMTQCGVCAYVERQGTLCGGAANDWVKYIRLLSAGNKALSWISTRIKTTCDSEKIAYPQTLLRSAISADLMPDCGSSQFSRQRAV